MYSLFMAKIKVSSLVQDRRKGQELLDQAAQADAREGLRQGLEEARKGLGRPAREFFEEFEARNRLFR